MAKLITLLTLVSIVSSYGLHLLGVGVNSDGTLFSAVGTLDTGTGDVSFGANSSAYIGGQQICINAFIPYATGASYAVGTAGRYEIVSEKNSIHVNYSLFEWVTIAWTYSETLNHIVVMGWQVPSDIFFDEYFEIFQINGAQYIRSLNDVKPQIATVNVTTGKVKHVGDIDGGAFLMCGSAVTDNAPNNSILFHYVFLDDQMKNQLVGTYDVTHKNSYSLEFNMTKNGQVFALSSLPGNNNILIVSNPGPSGSGTVWNVSAVSQDLKIIGTLSNDYVTVVLGASTYDDTTGLLYTLVQSDPSLNTLVTFDLASGSSTYVDLPQSQVFRAGYYSLAI
jgi:hypothetical protein